MASAKESKGFVALLLILTVLGASCDECATSELEYCASMPNTKSLLQTQVKESRQTTSIPQVISWDGATMLDLKQQLADMTAPDWAQASQLKLLEAAEAIKEFPANLRSGVGAGPWSPTQKKLMPPSKDKRDYRTISGYSWPCNTKCEDTEYYKQGKCSLWESGKRVISDAPCDETTGVPYVIHDGFLNYDNLQDLNIMIVAMESLETLTLASWFASDALDSAKYAESAMQIFRSYLLENSTRLNPRLLFGGALPGKYPNGTAGALIAPTFRMNSMFVDCATLLKVASPAVWTADDDVSWKAWLQEWVKWLKESEFGKIEMLAIGNHGTFAYVHKLALFHAIGAYDDALHLIHDLRTVLPAALTKQITPSGEMPIETARVTGQTYSLMNLEGLFLLGTVVENSCKTLSCDPDWDWNWEAPVAGETKWETFEGMVSYCKYFGAGSVESVDACKNSCLEKEDCNGVVTKILGGELRGCYLKQCAGTDYLHKPGSAFTSLHLIKPPPEGSGSIRRSLDYLRPYARGEKVWTDDHQGSGKEKWTALAPALYRAAAIYNDPSLAAEAIRVDENFPSNKFNLLYPRAASPAPAPIAAMGYDGQPCPEASLSGEKVAAVLGGCKWLYGAAVCSRFVTKAGGTYCAEGDGAKYGHLTIDNDETFDARCACCGGLSIIDKDSSNQNHCK